MADDDLERTLRGRDLVGLGGVLVGAVVVGMLVGLFIDDQAGSSPVGVLCGIAAGVILGCLAFALKVRAALKR